MRKIVLLFTLLFSTISSAQIDCEVVKEGKFKVIDNEYGDMIIQRTQNQEISFNSKTGVKVESKITWTDECSYTIVFHKVLENPKNIDLQINIEAIDSVKIIDVKNGFYSEEYMEGTYNIIFPRKLLRLD
ncbi:hypothetical protein QSV08_20725 [Maribacter sp. BPC-D8]|uniref:hypothetical protein n=1 Tax=Maribacter sp. BPC-D8 TaxID=3053613 RepID=UPI002B474C55|nr:hypothetical protein [Maribacter sp. BPC-D8]WRI29624.1 hypothetical protein QSV08_20725 [Maribacter sp. BPC-D8]